MRKVVVTGCLAQRYSQDLAGRPCFWHCSLWASIAGIACMLTQSNLMQRACRRRIMLLASRHTAACPACCRQLFRAKPRHNSLTEYR